MLEKFKNFIIDVVKSAVVDALTGKEPIHIPLDIKVLVDGKEKAISSYVKTEKGDATLVVSVEDKVKEVGQ